MSSFDVDSFNYEYAHQCYQIYVSGNMYAPDSMYEKGKEVAESKKWLHYVTKWQTEDITVYEMDEEGLDENAAQDKSGLDGAATTGAIGAAAAGGLAAGATATTTTTTTVTLPGLPMILGSEAAPEMLETTVEVASNTASTGALVAAVLYFAVGLIFLGLTAAFKVKAQNSRKQQEAYFNTAEEIIKYDFASKMEEANMMYAEMNAFTEQAAELSTAANVQISNANTVASATAVSASEVSTAARAKADEGAAQIIDDLDELDTGVLDNLPKLDSILKEIDARKEMLYKIKAEIPKFEKNRKEQLIMMSVLAGAGALGAIGGAIGLAMSWTNYAAAAWAAALFIIGIAAFAAAAIVAGIEILPQKSAKEDLKNNKEQKVNTSLSMASKAHAAVASARNAGYINDTSITQMIEEAREEDGNVNMTGNGEGGAI